ncbi:hypothetical protein E2F48_08005 [Arthrobacter crusticola]|uniref:Uncharacterized protein n=1 Tax=Arthrobacter crusticola TaxID=2547960 RepID=A0A4R5TVV4_9MICC|nr:hypothetical protein [Arthrobacter crusticola]TDK25220.1 hypothetical protein E2F48_08005 [Arthrobacter crusticola]
MTSDRPNGGAGGGPPGEELSWVQRLMLYFTTPLRRTMAVLVVVGAWFALTAWTETAGDSLLLGLLPGLFFYPSIFVLAVLFTRGGYLRRPVRLPSEVMQSTAAGRFSTRESWTSPQEVSEALSTLRTEFARPGATARKVESSLWVELGKDWDTTGLRHQEASVYLKQPVFLHFFAEHTGGGTTVTAFSGDLRFTGVWDVLKLSDEMSAAAVELARNATSGESDGTPGPGSVSSPE